MQKLVIKSEIFILLGDKGKDQILEFHIETENNNDIETTISAGLELLESKILNKLNPSSEVIGNHSTGDNKAD